MQARVVDKGARRSLAAEPYAPWLKGLGKLFHRVALFEVHGTDAMLVAVRGMAPPAMRVQVSLLDATPLRWAVEAGSPVVLSGRTPGVAALSAVLGASAPKAFAVVPLVVEGRLAALAYGDRAGEPLPLDAVSELFSLCSRVLSGERRPGPRAIMRSTARRTHRLGRPPALRAAPPQRLQGVPDETDAPHATAEIDEATSNRKLGGAPGELPWTEAVTLIDPVVAAESPATVVDFDPFADVGSFANDGAREVLGGALDSVDALALKVLGEAGFGEWQIGPEEESVDTSDSTPIASSPNAAYADATPVVAPPAPIGSPRVVVVEAPTVALPSAENQLLPLVEDNAAWVVTADGLLSRPTAATPRRRGRPWFIITTLAATVAALAVLATVAPPRLESWQGASTEVAVEIPAHATLADIARLLEERELARNAMAIRGIARLFGQDRQIKAGSYRLSRGVWAWQLLDELVRGQVSSITVTIPEGASLKDIATILSRDSGVASEAYIAAASDPQLLLRHGIPGTSAEGYLFPETYTFAKELRPVEVLSLMIDEMMRRLAAIPETQGLSAQARHERLTLASIVEREARVAGEQKRIAGVFQNRLDRFMRLESCATIQYLLGEPKERLLIDDLQIDSPYNTYLRPGLPPAPIASAGEGALAAAFGPERHEYLFFVAREDGSGRHIFTKTYTDHQKAQKRVRAAVSERG